MNFHLPQITKKTVFKAAMLSIPVVGGLALAALSTAALPIAAGLGLAGIVVGNVAVNTFRPMLKKSTKVEDVRVADIFKNKSLLPRMLLSGTQAVLTAGVGIGLVGATAAVAAPAAAIGLTLAGAYMAIVGTIGTIGMAIGLPVVAVIGRHADELDAKIDLQKQQRAGKGLKVNATPAFNQTATPAPANDAAPPAPKPQAAPAVPRAA